MDDQVPLRLISFIGAVLWTAGMLWWSAPLDAAAVTIWVVAGALFGFLWHWAMSRWLRWYLGQKQGL